MAKTPRSEKQKWYSFRRQNQNTMSQIVAMPVKRTARSPAKVDHEKLPMLSNSLNRLDSLESAKIQGHPKRRIGAYADIGPSGRFTTGDSSSFPQRRIAGTEPRLGTRYRRVRDAGCIANV